MSSNETNKKPAADLQLGDTINGMPVTSKRSTKCYVWVTLGTSSLPIRLNKNQKVW